MGRKNINIETDLVGTMVVPRPDLEPVRENTWGLKPNLAGQFFGTVRAVWLDNDGEPKCFVQGPAGDTKILFLSWLDTWVA